MTQACAKHIGAGSSIIDVSGVLALTSVGLPQAVYSAGNSALVVLTRDLAVEWGGRLGIRVCAIAPGYFPIAMTNEMVEA